MSLLVSKKTKTDVHMECVAEKVWVSESEKWGRGQNSHMGEVTLCQPILALQILRFM